MVNYWSSCAKWSNYLLTLRKKVNYCSSCTKWSTIAQTRPEIQLLNQQSSAIPPPFQRRAPKHATLYDCGHIYRGTVLYDVMRHIGNANIRHSSMLSYATTPPPPSPLQLLCAVGNHRRTIGALDIIPARITARVCLVGCMYAYPSTCPNMTKITKFDSRVKSSPNQMETHFGTKVGTTPVIRFTRELYHAQSRAQQLL